MRIYGRNILFTFKMTPFLWSENMVKFHSVHDLNTKLEKLMKFVSFRSKGAEVKLRIVEMRSSHIGGHVAVSMNSPSIGVNDGDHVAQRNGTEIMNPDGTHVVSPPSAQSPFNF